MQLFGWTLHSCWMLLTVISVCSCVDIGSSAEINDEVMEEQPWIWNDFKLAGAIRSKLQSGFDEAEEDNDNLAASDEMDKAALPISPVAVKKSLNYRGRHHQRGQQRMESTVDNPNEEDYNYYDVERRPLNTNGRVQFNIKRNDKKRSHNDDALHPSIITSHRQPQQSQGTSISSSSSLTVNDVDSPSSLSVSDVEPRVLPLLGFHAAINKISRPKEALLKKILRQAARRQSMKRSPNCMRKCIAQGLLHPAQCHSLC